MIVRGATIAAFAESSWSRAKKEPRVFRLEGTLGDLRSTYCHFGPDNACYVSAYKTILPGVSGSAKVEVVLTVHEE